jgi:hypothetical protein
MCWLPCRFRGCENCAAVCGKMWINSHLLSVSWIHAAVLSVEIYWPILATICYCNSVDVILTKGCDIGVCRNTTLVNR